MIGKIIGGYKMKRLYFFILCLCFSNFLFGQQSPIIGYDKLEFGATIEAFQRMYPTAKEISSNKNSIGVRSFEQTNVGSGINKRIFNFYNNKFYQVQVAYTNLTVNSMNGLLDRITEVYGRFNRKEEDTDFPSDMVLIKTEIIKFVREYRNNFHIVATTYQDFFIMGDIRNTAIVSYQNPITVLEIYNAERKQAGSGLGL